MDVAGAWYEAGHGTGHGAENEIGSGNGSGGAVRNGAEDGTRMVHLREYNIYYSSASLICKYELFLFYSHTEFKRSYAINLINRFFLFFTLNVVDPMIIVANRFILLILSSGPNSQILIFALFM